MTCRYRQYLAIALLWILPLQAVGEENLAQANTTPPPVKKTIWDERKEELEKKMAKAMAREPRRATELDSACGGWHSPRVLALDLTLAPRLKICSGISALLKDQRAVAQNRFFDALSLSSKIQGDAGRDLEAEALFHLAELKESALSSFESCGTRLGLQGMRVYEAELVKKSKLAIDKQYREILNVGSKKWTSIALFRIATRADDFYQKHAFRNAVTYRGIVLPSPYSFDTIQADRLLFHTLQGANANWPLEIIRLFEIALQKAEEDGASQEMRSAIRNRIANLKSANLMAPIALSNPWLSEHQSSNLIRYRNRQFEIRNASGTWSKSKSKVARKLIAQELAKPSEELGLAYGYALVALAESKPKSVKFEFLERALLSENKSVRFAGYRAIELAPQKETFDLLLQRWKVERGEDFRNREVYHSRYKTLQAAMYGSEERLLLALRAVVTKHRKLANKLSKETKTLPRNERAWVLAELGDSRFQYRYQELIENGGQEARAISLYGIHKAIGERSKWLLYKHKHGVAGCLSNNLLRWEKNREKRIVLDPLGDEH
jgi:hypothetical protein